MLKQGTRTDVNLIRQGSYQGASDVQDHYWFDTLPFEPSTISNIRFFSGPISPSKTIQETNLQDAGKFPTGQSFVLNAFQPHLLAKFDEATPEKASQVVTDYYTVLEESLIEIVIAGREFDFQGPGSVWLPSVSIAQQTEAAAVGITETRVGDFNHRNWLPMKTPITIGELVSFQLRQTINVADAQVAAALGRLSDTSSGKLAAKLRWTFRGTLERLK